VRVQSGRGIVEERAGGGPVQGVKVELVDPPGVECRRAVAHREHQRDAAGAEPPRGEQQRGRGRAVQPLRVVDQAEQRTVALGVLDGLGEQAEYGQAG
jgi:hypothetical protein